MRRSFRALVVLAALALFVAAAPGAAAGYRGTCVTTSPNGVAIVLANCIPDTAHVQGAVSAILCKLPVCS